MRGNWLNHSNPQNTKSCITIGGKVIMTITNNDCPQNPNLEVNARTIVLKTPNRKSKIEIYISEFYYKKYSME